MKTRKMTRREQVLLCVGLLLTTMPLLFKEYLPIPDFARGFLEGVGLVMEITALVLISKRKNAELACRSKID